MVTTAPIKGTAPRAPERWTRRLRASAKDAAENVMIVDLMRNDLSRVCRPGTVAVDELLSVQPHPASGTWCRRCAGSCEPGTSTADLLTATFPPGSVTGAPKIAARQAIAELEPERAARTPARSVWSARRRHRAQRAHPHLRDRRPARCELGVGGGITVDSVPIREWYECLHKAAPLVGGGRLAS